MEGNILPVVEGNCVPYAISFHDQPVKLPPDMPTPKGKPVPTTIFVDANLMHDLTNRKSASGIIHMINLTPTNLSLRLLFLHSLFALVVLFLALFAVAHFFSHRLTEWRAMVTAAIYACGFGGDSNGGSSGSDDSCGGHSGSVGRNRHI